MWCLGIRLLREVELPHAVRISVNVGFDVHFIRFRPPWPHLRVSDMFIPKSSFEKRQYGFGQPSERTSP